jgi:hypothetical protein
MYLWESASLSGELFGEPSREVCYHAAAAVTDAQGRFHIPEWEKPQPYKLPNREPTGWAYAKGYVPDALTPPEGQQHPQVVHPNDVFRLVLSTAAGDQRLEELWHVIRRDCAYGNGSQRSMYPLLKAAYDEAKVTATNQLGRDEVAHFARLVARAWLAPSPNGRSAAPEIDTFIREHLE